MSGPRHIALNAVFLRPRMGGLETYVRRLVPELVRLAPDTRFSVFVGPEGREALASEPWSGEVALQTHPLLGLPGGKAASELTLLGALAPRRGADLLYSVAMTGPLRTRAVHVLGIPDVIWLAQPDPAEMATVRLWKAVVPRVARRADRVIAMSRATADEVVRLLGVPAERVDAVLIGPGADAAAQTAPEAEVRARHQLGGGPIVLSVSAKKEHKNLRRLVGAMRTVVERHPDAVLVLPGNPTPHEDELRALAARLGLAANVRFPAWVGDADLEGLYAAAACTVVASLHEGFGLPVLEAMRRGVPVACSNRSALPEVGGDAIRSFDPLDESAIAAAVLDLLDDRALAAELVDRGHRRAAELTWERCAENTLASFERAWAGRR